MHVVFGTGPLGLAVMRALGDGEKQVRMVNRSGRTEAPSDVEVVAADATDRAAARRACAGAAVVYHCAMAPYAQWPAKLPAIMAGIMEGAASAGARLVYGDNLYAYGRVSGPLTEDLPYRSASSNGRVRALVATMLMEAHGRGEVPATIGRASDFFGSHVRLSKMGDRVFIPVLRGRAAQVLGDPDVPHTYTFIDDFARALVTLGERPEALGQVWHVPSAETLTTRRFVEMVCAEAGAPMRLAAAPRLGIAFLALFDPTMRAVKDQLYESEQPFLVGHSKYARAFGGAPTPHREAIQATLQWYRGSLHTSG